MQGRQFVDFSYYRSIGNFREKVVMCNTQWKVVGSNRNSRWQHERNEMWFPNQLRCREYSGKYFFRLFDNQTHIYFIRTIMWRRRRWLDAIFIYIYIFLHSVPFPFVKSYFLRNGDSTPFVEYQIKKMISFLVFNFLPAIRTQLINSTESIQLGSQIVLRDWRFFRSWKI
jgi:hypothetical protein